MIEIKQLEMFCSVYSNRSVTLAASELYLTPQAVSKALSTFERELGVRLFERASTGLLPLKAANELYARAAPLLAQAAKLEEDMAALRDEFDESCSVGFTYNLVGGESGRVPLSFLLGFQRRHPEVALSLAELSSDECERRVKEGLLDGALVVGPADEGAFDVLASLEDSFKVCVSRSSRLAEADELSLADLAGETVLIPPDNANTRRAIEGAFARRGLAPDIRAEKIQQLMRFQYIYDGMGVGFIPTGTQPWVDLSRGALVPLAPQDRLVLPVDLIVRRGRRPPSVIADLARALQSEVGFGPPCRAERFL